MQKIQQSLHHIQIRTFPHLTWTIQNGIPWSTTVSLLLLFSVPFDICEGSTKNLDVTKKFFVVFLFVRVPWDIKDAFRAYSRRKKVGVRLEWWERWIWSLSNDNLSIIKIVTEWKSLTSDSFSGTNSILRAIHLAIRVDDGEARMKKDITYALLIGSKPLQSSETLLATRSSHRWSMIFEQICSIVDLTSRKTSGVVLGSRPMRTSARTKSGVAWSEKARRLDIPGVRRTV